jgi:hypothetical protein
MIGASQTPFRIKPPRLLADSATESMANNVYASKLQQGQTKGYDAQFQNAGKGFSVGSKDRMLADQQRAAGAAEGAQAAASIRADDQQFNESQKNAHQMLRDQALVFDKNQATELNNANFQRMFANRQGKSEIAMARQRAAMNLRLALMSQGLA